MERREDSNCFTELTGLIDNCCCTIEEVDELNSQYMSTRINKITGLPFFRYYKFHVHSFCKHLQFSQDAPVVQCDAETGDKGVTEHEEGEEKINVNNEEHLGYIKTTNAGKDLELKTDSESEECDASYCIYLKGKTEEMIWVDLDLNPLQHTGYQGRTIWEKVYDVIHSQANIIDLCEQRIFYQTMSGLHTSINTHVCYKYVADSNPRAGSTVMPNLEEFNKRFDPEATNALGPSWLKNMYFTYIIVLRAIIKAESYWQELEDDDADSKQAGEKKAMVKDLIVACNEYPNVFENAEIDNLASKDTFDATFKIISGIFDHTTCERCRLWGKLQINGVSTAFKILSSYNKDDVNRTLSLSKLEMVSLFHTLCKLSDSLEYVSKFKNSRSKSKWWMLFSNEMFFRGVESHIDFTLRSLP